MKADYIIVGKVGSTYGVQGWLKVYSYTEWVDDVLTYTPWYLGENDNWSPITLSESREHGKGIIVKFSGYDTPESARLLTGKLIAILRSQLPQLKEGEYYWDDLKGLTVINQNGANLGKIIYIMETGSNDVLVVKGDTEHAIPYLPDEVIKRIDLENQVMYVDWDLL